MPILDDAKQTLRISSTAFDQEVSDLVEMAKADLKLSGVLEEKILDTDPLIKQAILIYCKGNFGLDNSDAEKMQKSYEMLKGHLCLTADYTEASS